MENLRKDQDGRHRVSTLGYYKGINHIKKTYLEMNIHERIMRRVYFCGIEYPTIMIAMLIESEKENSLQTLSGGQAISSNQL